MRRRERGEFSHVSSPVLGPQKVFSKYHVCVFLLDGGKHGCVSLHCLNYCYHPGNNTAPGFVGLYIITGRLSQKKKNIFFKDAKISSGAPGREIGKVAQQLANTYFVAICSLSLPLEQLAG